MLANVTRADEARRGARVKSELCYVHFFHFSLLFAENPITIFK